MDDRNVFVCCFEHAWRLFNQYDEDGSTQQQPLLTLIFDLRDVGHLPDGIRIDCVDDGHIVGHNAAVGRPLRVRHDDPLREVGEHAEVVTNEEGVGHEGQLLAA